MHLGAASVMPGVVTTEQIQALDEWMKPVFSQQVYTPPPAPVVKKDYTLLVIAGVALIAAFLAMRGR